MRLLPLVDMFDLKQTYLFFLSRILPILLLDLSIPPFPHTPPSNQHSLPGTLLIHQGRSSGSLHRAITQTSKHLFFGATGLRMDARNLDTTSSIFTDGYDPPVLTSSWLQQVPNILIIDLQVAAGHLASSPRAVFIAQLCLGSIKTHDPTEINNSSYMPQYLPQGPYLEVDAFLICFDVSEAVPNHLPQDAQRERHQRDAQRGRWCNNTSTPGAFGTIPSSALPSPTDWPVPMV